MHGDTFFHQPVMVAEVIQHMNLQQDKGFYCDCTVGGAGHLIPMLKATKQAKFIGIDWDPDAIDYAEKKVRQYEKRCFLFENTFTNLGLILDKLNISGLDGILFDLGVSYHQLTMPHRGFSFDREGMLLMHMSPGNPTLSRKIRSATKREIITVLKEFGDVRNCHKIGTQIFENRKSLKTTLDLRKVIEKTTPKRFLKKNLHKVFQALRIWVNDEINNLKQGLLTAFDSLNFRGRIIVISYHSGEDRVVKNVFRDLQKNGKMILLHKKVLKPTQDEIKNNPRARSAKFRAGEKCVVS